MYELTPVACHQSVSHINVLSFENHAAVHQLPALVKLLNSTISHIFTFSYSGSGESFPRHEINSSGNTLNIQHIPHP